MHARTGSWPGEQRLTAAPMRRSLWGHLSRALASANRNANCVGVAARDSAVHLVCGHRPLLRLARRALPAASAENAGTADAQAAVGSQYPFRDIEGRWQRYWEEHATFRTPDVVDTSKPKFYALDMFPYPRHVQIVCASVSQATRSALLRFSSILHNSAVVLGCTWATRRATQPRISWLATRCVLGCENAIECELRPHTARSRNSANAWVQCPPPDGLGRLRSSCRAVCHRHGDSSKHHDASKHRPFPPTAEGESGGTEAVIWSSRPCLRDVMIRSPLDFRMIGAARSPPAT